MQSSLVHGASHGKLVPALVQIKERIINVSSISAGSQMDWRNLEGEQRYSADAQYSTSKARALSHSASSRCMLVVRTGLR